MSDPTNLQEGAAPKGDPAAFALHTRPRPVRRFNRKLLIGLAAGASAVLAGATFAALSPPRLRDAKAQELYNTDRKPTAEGLAQLPRGYGDLQKATPQLGPPLSGDMGRPVVQMERDYGVAQVQSSGVGFQPDPEADAARAERLRLAQKAQQAREAGVFFQTSKASQPSSGRAPAASGQAGPPTRVAAADSGRLQLDLANDQNLQQRKLDFLNQGIDRDIYNPHSLQDPVSPYQVMAGAIIPASLVTGLNSDLPGMVVAQVTEHIYDSVSGKILLVPQGSRLIGSYDSVVAFGQSRALVVWQRIVMPDGSSIQIDNLPATDAAGYSGLEDQVDFHTWQLIKGIALSTLLGVGSQLGYSSREESDLVRALRQSTLQSANRTGQQITQKNLNIQPTLTVRPGWPLRVIVHKDLVLRPYRG